MKEKEKENSQANKNHNKHPLLVSSVPWLLPNFFFLNFFSVFCLFIGNNIQQQQKKRAGYIPNGFILYAGLPFYYI